MTVPVWVLVVHDLFLCLGGLLIGVGVLWVYVNAQYYLVPKPNKRRIE